MNAERLLQHFDRISEAPDAIPRLRRFILDLAVRGKLVKQDPNDELGAELLKRIQAEKARLVKEGKIKKNKPLVPIDNRVHPDLWYPGPPRKGGHRHGDLTLHRSPDAPDRGARFDQSHRERVGAARVAL
jgi:hypothetical protein